MKCFYDLHIHSALSPCADNDMTPNNIVNMALIKGLDIIAVTDHNSCANLRAVMEVAEGQLCVIPGMEIETSEEVHVVCYFPTLEIAEEFSEFVDTHLPMIENQPDIFGEQLILDAEDEIIGHKDKLLVNATDLDIYEVFEAVKKRGGVAVPAHIDRSSYSILSNLGFLPPDLSAGVLEITPKARDLLSENYPEHLILSNSDAHYLEDISEPVFTIDILSKNPKDFVDFLLKRE